MNTPTAHGQGTPPPIPTVQVWDPAVRLFHWLLVAAMLAAAATGFFGDRTALTWHLISGTSIAALVAARVIWGMLGGGYARFASFAFKPRAILNHARRLRDGSAVRHLGHNPLGGLMVFALLAVLILIVLTGVVTLGGQVKQGPLAFAIPFSIGWSMRGVHKLFALLAVAMIAAHLGGVWFESRREGENLARAMLTGRKRREPGPQKPMARAHPIAAGILLLALAAATTSAIITLDARPALGVPTAPLDADYKRECGACHMVYHPSLEPAANWNAMLDHLDSHFGEDASLDPAIVAHLRSYLNANAAEHWDTLPAVLFRTTLDPQNPLRLTATRIWRRIHDDIPDAAFKVGPVTGRGNCIACHTDAETGLFTAQHIHAPEPKP